MARNVLGSLLVALAATVSLGAAEPVRLLQGTHCEDGRHLRLGDNRAWLVRPGGQRLRLPVRRGERLEELVAFDGGWAAAGVRRSPARRELVVVVDGAAGVERLRAVPEPLGALRVAPVPLASATAFEGLAWLEGDGPQGYSVRVAGWTGAGWEPPETVSAPEGGGQAGLVGTVLDDGSWLLVWSAARGGNGEIVWSRRRGGRWSPPQRLTAANRVPDQSPTLVRAPGGALVAWARLDGSAYRLRLARFRGGAWGPVRAVGGAGASTPRFVDLGSRGRFLLARTVGGWTVLQVDDGGTVRRAGEIDGERRDPPLLTAAGGGLTARWEGARALPVRWRGELR